MIISVFHYVDFTNKINYLGGLITTSCMKIFAHILIFETDFKIDKI